MLQYNNGWMCFFYTDEDLKITGIRLRKPNEKNFAYCKLSEDNKGVFGSNLFGINNVITENNEQVLFQVEGEFNGLAIQSLYLNIQDADEENIEYLNVVAIGSSTDPDLETVKKINEHPCIIFDNDDAGWFVVRKAQQTMHVSGFTVPKEKNDIDAFIVEFGEDHKNAWNSFIGLYEQRKFYYKHLEALEKESTLIRMSKYKEFQINKDVSITIINDLKQRAILYQEDSEVYLFNKETKELFKISEYDGSFMLLMHKYGINRTETLFKYLVNSIRIEGITNGIKSQINKFTYYNTKTFTLYLYNNANQVYKITADKIELEDNGVDGILFFCDSEWEPFKMVEEKSDRSLFDEIVINTLNFEKDKLSDSERQLLFKIWIESLFFENIMPTKPILCALGEKGSGKSFVLKKVGKLIFGSKFDVSPLVEKEDDFDVAISNSLLYVIDNADSNNRRWLEDKLATVSTGATTQKRKLYTDDITLKRKPHCFLGITSRTPYFRRDDVSERLIILKLAKLKGNIIPEYDLTIQILENRDKIMTEIIYNLQKIIRVYKENVNSVYKGETRMGDFASFAVKVAEADDRKEEIEKILKKLSTIQTDFTFEMDPLFELLSVWSTSEHDWSKFNYNRFVTHQELYIELAELASKQKMEFYFKSHLSFAQKMRSIKSNLEKYFIITEKSCGGHIVKRSFKLKDTEEEINGYEEIKKDGLEEKLF